MRSTALVHYTRLTGDDTYRSVIANTFDRCKEFEVDDDPENVWVCRNFINAWHDDAGWWVLVWIDACDLTGDERYLRMAETTFADMTTGWDDDCDGGVYWKKPNIGKHTITNGLFMISSLRLHHGRQEGIWKNVPPMGNGQLAVAYREGPGQQPSLGRERS